MINKSIPFCKFAPENASGMAREWSGIASALPRKLFALLFCLLFVGVGNAWGTVLFHETFGAGGTKARAWDNSYSVKSGVTAVYSGVGNYTMTNLKQGNSSSGNGGSGASLIQTTTGTDAVFVVGPLNVSNYNTLVVTYKWKAGSIKGTYSTSLYYKTSSGGSFTEVSGTGNGATTYVTRTYNLPVAAQVSTLYLKVVFNTSNTQAYIDEFELTGTAAASGYSITYHCNDATSGCPSDASGQSALPNPLPSAPTKTGFTFGGWYTNSTLTTAAVAGATLSANADLYAKWTCNVTLNRNGATETINNVVEGTALDDIDGTGAQGGCSAWTFVGWSKTQRAAQNNTTPMTLATTVDGAGPYYAVYRHTESGGVNTASSDNLSSTSTSAQTVEAGKPITYTCSVSNSYSDPARIYKNNTFTVAGGTITEIVLTGVSDYAISNMTVNTGTLDTDGDDGTWTGSATSVVFTASTAQTRIAEISVTYSGGDTYYYSTTASCCTPLGSINGSVNLTTDGCGAGELKATWKMLATTGIASQTLRVYDENLEEVTAKRITGITASTSNQTKTISGLNPCKEYYVTVENVSSGGEYCAPGDPWESDVVTTLGYTYTITKNNVSLKGGESEAARACEDFMAEYVANTGYALPTTISVSGASAYEWEDGVLSIEKANVTGNVTVTISGTCVEPAISAGPADANYYVGDSPTPLSVTATLASGTLTYLWKVSTNGGSTWSDAEGTNNAATYSGASLSTASAGTLKFKCIVGNSQGGCTVESGVATITVNAASSWKLKGSWDSWEEHTMIEDAGVASYSISLDADSRFEFGFDGGSFYKNNGTIITTTSGWVFNTKDNNCHIHTGPAGIYTFTINTTTKAVTVTYPTVSHPNEHYVYFKNTNVWGTVYGYLANSGNDNKAAAWPGSVMQPTTTICGETYHYAALNAMSGTYNVINFNDGGSGYGHQTSDLSTTGSLGKYNANQDASWHQFKYAISFDKGTGSGDAMSSIENLCPGSNQTLTSNSYTKTYNSFVGWIADVDVKVGESTIEAGNIIADGATIKDIQSDIALTAQWSIIPVTALTLNYSSLKKYVGESTVTLSVSSVTPSSADPSVTWTSSDGTIASVTAAGVVSFLKAGTATITATSAISGGVTATCSVEVRSISGPTMKDTDGTTISGSGLSATWTVGTRTLAASEGTSLYKFKRWVVTNAAPASTTNATTTLGDPTGDVTIVAEYYKPITVTWKVGTAAASGSPTTEVKYGAKISALPSTPADNAVASCGANKFMGWTAAGKIEGTGHDAPADLFTTVGGATTLTENTTYRAVFATQSGGGYEQVTSLAGIKEGSAYFAYYGSYSGYRWYGVNAINTVIAPVDVSEGVLTTSKTGDGAYTLQEFTLVAVDASAYEYYIKIGNKYVIGSTTNATDLSLSDDAYLWKFNSINGSNNNLEILHDAATDCWIKVGVGTATGGKFRSYTTTGQQVSLFQSTLTISDYITGCCTQLDDLNGEVNWSNPTTAVVSWDDIDHVDSWTVKYKTHAAGEWSTAGASSASAGTRSVTISSLTPCVDYDFQIIATPEEDYCDKDQTIEDDQTHAYSVDYSGCSNVTKTGGGTTACGSSNLVATFTASLPYELPSSVSVSIGNVAQTQGTDFTWVVSEGVGTLTICSAKQTGNIVIDVDGNLLTCDVNPTIGTATLDGSGTFSLTSVSVSVTGCSVEGVVCEWTDYGFVWGTSANPTGNKTAIGSDGTATSWSGTLTGSFSTGDTYYYRAYGKNSKDGAAIVYGSDATFIPRSVTFNSNGGSNVDTKYVASGGTVSAPVAPNKDGYTFGGWYTDNGTWASPVNWSSTISADVTYYAKWNTITYYITYEGLSGASNTNPEEYNIETPTITLVDPGTREGWTFAGWTCGGDPITQIAVGSMGDKTITATWTINQYNVAVDEVDGVTIHVGDLDMGENADVNYGTELTLAKGGLGTGIYWVGWKVTNAGGDDVTASVVSENTLTVPAYDITVTAVLGKMKAWCMPEFEVTGDIHLTSVKGVYVNSTSTTGDLLTFSGTNTENITKITIDYLDNNGDVVATKSSSPLRLYNSAGSLLAEGNITSGFSTGTYSGSFSVRFIPTAYDELDNYKLQLKIYKDTRVIKTVEHPMNGRALPEEFVIAVKQNDQWYALPNTILDNNRAITPLKITVNDATTPTAATYAPSTAVYKGYETGNSRYAAGTNVYGVRLTDPNNKWLQVSSSSGTNYVWVSGTGNATCQDWWLSSSDFSSYTLKVPSSGAGDKSFGINNLGNIGYFASDATNLCKEVFLLPITNKYTEIAATVSEWGQNSVVLAANPGASANKAQAHIDDGSPTEKQDITAINGVIGTAKNVKVPLGDIDLDVSEGNEGKLLYIDWFNGSTLLGTSKVTIPRIVAEDRTANKTNDTDKKVWNTEVHVLPGATLTIDGESFKTGVINSTVSVNELQVYPGATINVSTGTLAASTLRLRNGWTRAGDKKYDVARVYIAADAALTKGTASMDYNIYELADGQHFYPLAVPFPVAVSAIDYADSWLAGYSTYGMSGQYVIKEYNGARRAEKGPDQQNNWTPLAEGATLSPGKGYIMAAVPVKGEAIIRVPLTFDNGWTSDGEKASYDDVTKNVVSVEAYAKAEGETKNANKGWNLLGVPFMSCYTTSAGMYAGDGAATIIQGKFDFDDGTWDDDKVRYVSVPVHDFSEYIQTDITDDDTKLLPGWSFFVQIETSGNLTFLTAQQAEDSDLPIYAPKRGVKADMPTLKTGIILSDGEKSDKTTFLVSDKYNGAEYEINADLEKMFGNGYTLATYSLAGNTRLAYNAMSNADAANIIPIGYRAPAEGEYTFSINPRYAQNGAFESVNLIDYETGIVTDLLQYSYTFSTGRTQNDSRFAINVVKQKETPTDIENIQGDELQGTNVRKLLIDGKVYIIRGGQMYDATGKQVKGGAQ